MSLSFCSRIKLLTSVQPDAFPPSLHRARWGNTLFPDTSSSLKFRISLLLWDRLYYLPRHSDFQALPDHAVPPADLGLTLSSIKHINGCSEAGP